MIHLKHNIIIDINKWKNSKIYRKILPGGQVGSGWGSLKMVSTGKGLEDLVKKLRNFFIFEIDQIKRRFRIRVVWNTRSGRPMFVDVSAIYVVLYGVVERKFKEEKRKRNIKIRLGWLLIIGCVQCVSPSPTQLVYKILYRRFLVLTF